ncbi:restriction endonuclease subunit S [bacterium AH-315-J21]|nr:restriction endonuclease subunit S [bacterium AH-315-J21]
MSEFSTIWEVKRLGDLCENLDNKRVPITKKDRVAGDHPYYGATGILGYVNDFIFDETLVLIGEDGAKWGVGEDTAFAASGKYWVNNHAHVIRPFRDKILDKWIIYFLNSSDLSSFTTGLTVPKLNQGMLKSIPIPLPPLPEQKRIVAILDEAFAAIDKAIANTEKNLANARELFESYLNNVFTRKGTGWIEKQVDDVSAVLNGFSFKSTDFAPTNEIKSIKITNVGVGQFVEESNNLLPQIFKDDYSESRVTSGSIVLALTRTIISSGLKVAMVPDSYDGALLNQRVAAIVPNASRVDAMFLYHFFRTEIVSRYVLANVNTLMQPNLSIRDLKRMPIPVPSLKSQEKTVQELDGLYSQSKSLEFSYLQKLTALFELKQSILQKAFSGELTAGTVQRKKSA